MNRLSLASVLLLLPIAASACAVPQGSNSASAVTLSANQSVVYTGDYIDASHPDSCVVPRETQGGDLPGFPSLSAGGGAPALGADSPIVEGIEHEEEEAAESLDTYNEALELGRIHERTGNARAARSAFTRALDGHLSAEDEASVLQSLTALNLKLFTSDAEDGDMQIYTVAQGDTLEAISKRYGTTWQLIRRVNGLPNNNLRIGQKLKLPRAELSVRVRKDKFTMDLLIGGDFVKRYTIGTGVNDSTPIGEFTVMNRIPYPADGSYPYGHPQHRLGTHWLGLKSVEGKYNGLGIHGSRTDEYNQLGTQCSKGCVRVRNDEAEELFDLLPIGTRVNITK